MRGWLTARCCKTSTDLQSAICRLAPVVQPTAEDQEALYNARSLLGLVNPPRPAGGVPDPANFRRDLAQAQKLARELQPLLPELLPGILLTGVPRSTPIHLNLCLTQTNWFRWLTRTTSRDCADKRLLRLYLSKRRASHWWNPQQLQIMYKLRIAIIDVTFAHAMDPHMFL